MPRPARLQASRIDLAALASVVSVDLFLGIFLWRQLGPLLGILLLGLCIAAELAGWRYLRGRRRRLVGNAPWGTANFFGPNDTLDMGALQIKGPMIYATSGGTNASHDDSWIDLSLPVHAEGRVRTLPGIWPSYKLCSPAQRAAYLKWILGGRQDPRISTAYVELFFYGLQRRILIDGQDHVPIVQEILRLSRIYKTNNALRRDLSAFLWLTMYLAAERHANAPQVGPAPTESPPAAGDPAAGDRAASHDDQELSKLADEAVSCTPHWNSSVLAICLAYFHAAKRPIPVRIAQKIIRNDPRAPDARIADRHDAMFDELFSARFAAAFPEGIQLRVAKRDRRLDFRPTNPTVHKWYLSSSEWSQKQIPNVLRVSSQFAPLIAVFSACVEELREFDKHHKNAGASRMTSAMYEALPVELRRYDHPEYERWHRLWQSGDVDEGVLVLPISKLAGVKGYAKRPSLTRKQCLEILATADAIGLRIEPDMRSTGGYYDWDQWVGLFHRRGEPTDQGNYRTASAMMRLATMVIQCEGAADRETLRHVCKQITDRFELSLDSAKRLDALCQVLIMAPRQSMRISAKSLQHLSEGERKKIGEYIVMLVAADRHISSDELTAIRKACRTLGLQPNEVEKLVHLNEKSAADAARSHEFSLDPAVIAQTMEETREVSRILLALAVEEPGSAELDDSPLERRDESLQDFTHENANDRSRPLASSTGFHADSGPSSESPVPEIPGEDQPFAGLPQRYWDFLTALVRQDEWPRDGLRNLAKEHKIMLDGAIETINDWACDRHGRLLIEEGDPTLIHAQLLPGVPTSLPPAA